MPPELWALPVAGIPPPPIGWTPVVPAGDGSRRVPPGLAGGGCGPPCRTSPLPGARAAQCPLASDLLLHRGLSNGSSSRFWLI